MKQLTTLGLTLAMALSFGSFVFAEDGQMTLPPRPNTGAIQPAGMVTNRDPLPGGGTSTRERNGDFRPLPPGPMSSTTKGMFRPLASTTMREMEKMRMMPFGSTTPKRQEVEQEIEMKKASSTERRINIQQDVAKRKAMQTSGVLTATLNRLSEIAGRLDSRIQKLKAQGTDTTLAEGFSADAKNYLTQAQHDIDAFSSIDLTADKAQTNFQNVRDAAQLVKSDFQDARDSLMNAVKSLPEGAGAGLTNPNPTGTTTNN